MLVILIFNDFINNQNHQLNTIDIVESQAFIFRCELPQGVAIRLSDEHSEYAYFAVTELSDVQQQRVNQCLAFNGVVCSAAF